MPDATSPARVTSIELKDTPFKTNTYKPYMFISLYLLLCGFKLLVLSVVVMRSFWAARGTMLDSLV